MNCSSTDSSVLIKLRKTNDRHRGTSVGGAPADPDSSLTHFYSYHTNLTGWHDRIVKLHIIKYLFCYLKSTWETVLVAHLRVRLYFIQLKLDKIKTTIQLLVLPPTHTAGKTDMQMVYRRYICNVKIFFLWKETRIITQTVTLTEWFGSLNPFIDNCFYRQHKKHKKTIY